MKMNQYKILDIDVNELPFSDFLQCRQLELKFFS